MKVFISVGMRGRNKDDVEKDIRRLKKEYLKKFSLDSDIEFIDNWNCEGPEDAGRLWYLGEAIKKLGDCDVCCFVNDWQKYKGCRVEYDVCRIYGIKILEEF